MSRALPEERGRVVRAAPTVGRVRTVVRRFFAFAIDRRPSRFGFSGPAGPPRVRSCAQLCANKKVHRSNRTPRITVFLTQPDSGHERPPPVARLGPGTP